MRRHCCDVLKGRMTIEFFLHEFLRIYRICRIFLAKKEVFEPTTSCVRDQHALVTERRSLNWTQFVLQSFLDSLNSLNSGKLESPAQFCTNCISSTRLQRLFRQPWINSSCFHLYFITIFLCFQNTRVVIREASAGRERTWTGPGFMRVSEGDSLRFNVDDIPMSMDYDIVVRYEGGVSIRLKIKLFKKSRRWISVARSFSVMRSISEARVSIVVHGHPVGTCRNFGLKRQYQ